VDVQSHPYIIGDGRVYTLGDVIQRLVHGEEEGDNLAPLGEVLAGGVYLELDVVGDMDIEDGVGWGYGVIGCWWTNGGGVVEVLASYRLVARLRRSRACVWVLRFWVEGGRFWSSVGRTSVAEGVLVVLGGMGLGGTVEVGGEKVALSAREEGCAAAPGPALIPTR
jgi:hypothetical protein